ncbi:MAG: DegT/DnrJ/EryC1/StrS family aminotransferase [Syntrophorhabdaceae bacterium]|nr:DegT/DnrJ/EryC1/StrS family aminotransferase [Syntrophorhabdaceae bacterium]
MPEPIHVTKAVVPDFQEYSGYLEQIFNSRHMTNDGVYLRKLENELVQRLNITRVALCSNGTTALQIALHAAGIAGKKIATTPFSFVATTSALLWTGCTPVFVDIDEETLCMDPAKLADVLDSDADICGILPVHIYGNICDVESLERLGNDAALPIVYDAAQCFGSKYMGKSLFDYGDLSVCSFHATKVFNTGEGGAVFARTNKQIQAIRLLRAGGHVGDIHIRLGINAKLSELHAATGLCLLDKTADNIAGRKTVSAMYDALLPERGIRRPKLRPGLVYNYAYYPVIFDSEAIALRIIDSLYRENIFPRRYYFPALNTLPYLPLPGQSCPVAESVARRVLCLPLYAELEEASVEKIAAIISGIV